MTSSQSNSRIINKERDNVEIRSEITTPEANKNPRFTLEEDDIIIEHYHQHEFLWNPSHEDYKFGWKSKSVADLAATMDNKFTPSQIHQRFSTMRSTYRQNKKKVNTSKGTGTASNHVYVPTWPHYESLTFLDDSEPTRKTQTSYTIQHDENDLYDNYEYLDDSGQQDPNSNNTPKNSKAKNISKNSKGNKRDRDEEVIDECLGVLRSLANSNENSSNENSKENSEPQDRCDFFGKYVISSLKCMRPWVQTRVMSEVTNVFVKYDENNPDMNS